MDRIIIEKIINHIISTKTSKLTTKCSKSDLSSADKEFIENFINSDEEWLDDEVYQNDEAWDIIGENQSKHKYTKDQENIVSDWSGSGFAQINGRLYGTKRYKEYIRNGYINDKEVIKKTKDLQSVIDDSPRIPIDVVTHREGHWDKGHKSGDVIVQKGFASTGLNGSTSVSFSGDNSYEITYYVPNGTKGALLTPVSFDGVFGAGEERELLLGKGTRQYILNQDDVNHEVEVLVLHDK